MSFPVPIPGLVIRYSYLWRAEYLRGQEEGVKDRPCAVVLVVQAEDGAKVVTVLPITHVTPKDKVSAVEIPQVVKNRLRLDSERSWIVFDEANQFLWPGPDLRAAPGSDISTSAYGVLPPGLLEIVKQRFLSAIRTRLGKIVPRSE